MAINDGEESGWVIEHPESPVYEPQYWTGGGWSKDNLKAIRFCRRLDAERTVDGCTLFGDHNPKDLGYRIAEHGWS